jgi:hypothetical protein
MSVILKVNGYHRCLVMQSTCCHLHDLHTHPHAERPCIYLCQPLAACSQETRIIPHVLPHAWNSLRAWNHSLIDLVIRGPVAVLFPLKISSKNFQVFQNFMKLRSTPTAFLHPFSLCASLFYRYICQLLKSSRAVAICVRTANMHMAYNTVSYECNVIVYDWYHQSYCCKQVCGEDIHHHNL